MNTLAGMNLAFITVMDSLHGPKMVVEGGVEIHKWVVGLNVSLGSTLTLARQ